MPDAPLYDEPTRPDDPRNEMTSNRRRHEPVGAQRDILASASATTVHRVAYAAVAVVGLAALSALLGWAFGVDALRRIVPGQPYMGFNSALSFVLLVLAWVLPRWARHACVVVVAVIALTTLAEYAFGIEGGLDQLVVDDPIGGAHPGRMAIATAVSLALLAAARELAELRRFRVAHWCAVIVVALSSMTFLGYAYDSAWLYNSRPIPTIVVHTAGSLLLLALAMNATMPSQAVRWSMYADDAGAMLTRRLVPVALVALPVVGALGLLGERHNLYNATTTAALIVVAFAVILGLVTWDAAQRLSRADRRRAQALAELTELKDELEQQVQQRVAQLHRRRNEIAVLEDRQRIAADLHDVVIQRLFAAGMYLQAGTARTPDADTQQRMETAVEAMDAAIKDLRASIFELGGRRESPSDLPTAMDHVCIESARVLGFVPALLVDDPQAKAERARSDILAVLREALANVARHAQASEVDVVLRCQNGYVELTVTDDGVGMRAPAGLSGTRNMIERARDLGGSCTWTAVEPHGTRVHWYMPTLAAAEH
jgi:signal transduction histidine kinase